MTRLSIEDLPKPQKQFRPDRVSDRPEVMVRFESKQSAQDEDCIRTRSIQRLLAESNRLELPASEGALRRLSNRIADAESPASSVYMRKHRIRIAGNLWSIIASCQQPVSAFTLIPRSWEFSGSQLHRANPIALLEQLRSALMREGAANARGWLFAAIHGEHEPNEDVYRVHVHGGASDEMIGVVDRLRKRSNFKSTRMSRKLERVYRRVRLTRKPLNNFPEPLTYMVQRFWPERPIYEREPDSWGRHKDKRRIEEPRHTEVMLWLDRWGLKDTTLLMGLHVSRSGLSAKANPYTNGDQA